MTDKHISELSNLFDYVSYGPQKGYAETKSRNSSVVKPKTVDECKQLINYCSKEEIKICCRGGGFSYGDMILNSEELILDTRLMNKVLDWDPETGLMTVQPGVSFASVFQLSLLDNWTLTSCPGGMDVTIAGAISNNVHGKDAWKNGNFGSQVSSFELMLADSKVIHIDRSKIDIFNSVIGGMGLFGVIVKIKLQLKKIPSPFVRVRTQLSRNIEESIEIIESREKDSDFIVSWVDAFVQGKPIGRGYVSSACWVEESRKISKEELKRSLTKPKLVFGFLPAKPIWFLGRLFFRPLFLKYLNKLHYYIAKIIFSDPDKVSEPILFTDYNFMHNKIPDIREVYRPHGFFEFEPLLPKNGGGKSLRALLELCQSLKAESLLCAIKSHKSDEFNISFEGEGYSIGIDIEGAVRGRKYIFKYIDAISKFTLEQKGKIYLAKDECLSRDDFKEMYPNYKKFLKLKKELDPKDIFYSDMYKRLMG